MKELSVAEKVYDAVLGMNANEEDNLIEGIKVEDLFAEGKNCDQYYEIVYKAKERLHSILSDSAYDDVEVIHQRLNQIMHDVSIKMFEYGVELGKEI